MEEHEAGGRKRLPGGLIVKIQLQNTVEEVGLYQVQAQQFETVSLTMISKGHKISKNREKNHTVHNAKAPS